MEDMPEYATQEDFDALNAILEDANKIKAEADERRRRLNIDDESQCPNEDKHTVLPKGYVQRHRWARSMQSTHKQTKCPACGLWAIWVPKKGE